MNEGTRYVGRVPGGGPSCYPSAEWYVELPSGLRHWHRTQRAAQESRYLDGPGPIVARCGWPIAPDSNGPRVCNAPAGDGRCNSGGLCAEHEREFRAMCAADRAR